MSESITLSRDGAEAIRHALSKRGMVVQALDAALDARIPWHHAAGLLADVRSHLAEPGSVHNADQSAAAFAAYLEVFGIDLRDERVVFEFLCFLSLLSSVSANACDRGSLAHDAHEALLVLGRSIAAILSVLAPEAVGS